MSDLLSRPMAELAALMGQGEIKARALAEEARADRSSGPPFVGPI
jgi:hypothetical protein